MQPYRETTTIAAGQVSVQREGKPARNFSIERAPELQALLASFSALLGGDAPALNRYYAIALERSDANWRLTLTPRAPALAKQLRDIVVDGKDNEPRCFSLHEADGDANAMLLGALAASQWSEPPTPAGARRALSRPHALSARAIALAVRLAARARRAGLRCAAQPCARAAICAVSCRPRRLRTRNCCSIEIGEGPASRLLLLAISNAPEEKLAAASRGLVRALHSDAHFARVLNGDTDLSALDPTLLPYRLSAVADAGYGDLRRRVSARRVAAARRRSGLARRGDAQAAAGARSDPGNAQARAALDAGENARAARRRLVRTGRRRPCCSRKRRAPAFDPAAQSAAIAALRVGISCAARVDRRTADASAARAISASSSARTRATKRNG